MIQRIQSLYLLLTTVLSGLFLKGSYLSFINKADSLITINFKGIYQTAGEKGYLLIDKLIPISIILILIPVLSILAIFLFKKRKLQLKVTLILIIFAALFIAISTYYGISIVQSYQATFVPGVKMFVPLLILVFSILAYRGIKKDENLVKSYDRLR
ncbi:MAG: DUF4293 domain-containing protein [Bacteroidia bacterium]|nr:DUF4293 domain-containing protein [Bacteroidia bacterium]